MIRVDFGLNVLGFLIFVIMGILLVAHVLPNRAALGDTFQRVLEVSDEALAVAATGSFLVALIFLVNAVDLGAHDFLRFRNQPAFWRRWRKKSLAELERLHYDVDTTNTTREEVEEEMVPAVEAVVKRQIQVKVERSPAVEAFPPREKRMTLEFDMPEGEKTEHEEKEVPQDEGELY